MAKKPRLHIPGGLYHVMLRGNGGQDIFIDDEDRLSPVFTDPARDGTIGSQGVSTINNSDPNGTYLTRLV